jgi:hypothetical protein
MFARHDALLQRLGIDHIDRDKQRRALPGEHGEEAQALTIRLACCHIDLAKRPGAD